jgi:5-methylcytosine-specific restriction endonuclease McrA
MICRESLNPKVQGVDSLREHHPTLMNAWYLRSLPMRWDERLLTARWSNSGFQSIGSRGLHPSGSIHRVTGGEQPPLIGNLHEIDRHSSAICTTGIGLLLSAVRMGCFEASCNMRQHFQTADQAAALRRSELPYCSSQPGPRKHPMIKQRSSRTASQLRNHASPVSSVDLADDETATFQLRELTCERRGDDAKRVGDIARRSRSIQ